MLLFFSCKEVQNVRHISWHIFYGNYAGRIVY